MGRLRWIALGGVAYVCFALAGFPAATAYRWLAPDQVRLAGLQGTVWSGEAAVGSVGELALHDIRWELRPLSLLIGRFGTRIEARLADGFVNSEIALSPGALWVSGLQASASLPALAPVLPPAVRGIQGLASATIERLEVRNAWPVAADGRLRLSGLAVPPLMPMGDVALIPLGDYQLDLQSIASGIRADLRDLGGPLEVSGQLQLGVDRRYELEGLVRARPQAPPELVQGLNIMTGEPDPNGRRRFSLSGSL